MVSSYLKPSRLNATNGEVIWSTNLVVGFGAPVIPWQNAASPVIENGRAFANANATDTTLAAIGAAGGNAGLLDGSVSWRNIRAMDTYRGSQQ